MVEQHPSRKAPTSISPPPASASLTSFVRIPIYAVLLILSYLASFTLAFEVVRIYAVGFRNMNFNDWQDYWHWNWHPAGELASFNSVLSYVIFLPVATGVLFLARRMETRLSKPKSNS